MNIRDFRTPEYKVEELILSRWSPRAMSGEPIAREELLSLFEAARWAPSAFNNQPWRFLYALRDTDNWPAFFDALVEFNQGWCRNAAALIVIAAHKFFEMNGKPADTHAFDTGMAAANLALQGNALNLVVHFMAGYDEVKVRAALGIPEDYAIMAMAALGRPGLAEDLPKDLQEKEQPSGRKAIRDLAYEGPFPT